MEKIEIDRVHPLDALGHGRLKRFLACITDDYICWIRGASTEFVLERRNKEAQVSENKPTTNHLQHRNVVATGQLRMDGISSLCAGTGKPRGTVGCVVGHTVDAVGTAALWRIGRGGSTSRSNNNRLIAVGGGDSCGGCWFFA